MKDLLYPLRILHGRYHEWKINVLPLYWERIRNPRAVYLIFTPEHRNLGDHAIAQSETEILNELEVPYIEVTGRKLEEWKKKGCLHVMNGRTILINGGGNLGTLWFEVESLTRRIIQKNPHSHIFILPNTFFYEDSEWGKKELTNSISIYNAHKHLKLFAREKISYEAMNAIYNDVALVPDMVLRMNKCRLGVKRKGCLLCLRVDREKTRSGTEEAVILQQTAQIFGDSVQWLDMVKDHQIPIADREHELELQYDAFRHAELVVTDRLHGMIFCAITGTPCIVINSKSPKVRGCFEWVKNLPYIRFCEDVSQISVIYRSIPKQDWQYDETKLLPLYEPLIYEVALAARGKKYASDKCYRPGISG